jgi:D-beta-D-heptose 7-phosphate kinase/D-beta-D-heptose 1-phosphate adenosyltransferase
MNKSRALSIIKKFSGVSILVIGDVMLDEYIEGSIERISPEAPIPVVTIFNRAADRRLGGAANVFNNLSSLGGRNVFMCGIIGDDAAGDAIKRQLHARGAEIEGLVVEPGRPTTVKTRIIAHNQQVVRLDREERTPISRQSRQKVIDYVQDKLSTVDALIVSDYEKGLINEPLLREIIARALRRGIVVAVDPKFSNFRHFKKVTIVVPNIKEARAFARHEIESPEDVLAAARYILKALACEYVLIKKGEQGMTLMDRRGNAVSIPTAALEVYDVTGAGDTVISSLVLAQSAGATWEEAARIANVAAGIAVSHLGTTTVELRELQNRIQNNRFSRL